MTDLVLSLAKIAASMTLLILVLAASGSSGIRLAAELRRKAIHVSLGLYCLTFPFLFSELWEVLLSCLLALGVFAMARGRLRATLGVGLHAVKRTSYGEVHFALAVAILFALCAGAPAALGEVAAYVLPIGVLTISDAAAALVGKRFGRRLFRIGDGYKSWEGVCAFAASAWLVSYASLTLFTDLDGAQIGAVSIAVACVGAAIEAASTRGWDNLLVPAGLYVVLVTTLNSGFDGSLAAAFAGASVLALAALIEPVRSPAR